jgi:hypothetical protein
MKKLELVCQTLDDRHKGHQYFKYRINLTGRIDYFIPRFVECMNWSVDNWGKSMPLRLYDRAKFLEFEPLLNPRWAWCDHKELHIYLRGDSEVSEFRTKWDIK